MLCLLDPRAVPNGCPTPPWLVNAPYSGVTVTPNSCPFYGMFALRYPSSMLFISSVLAKMRLNSRRVSRVKPHVPRDIDVDVASPVVLPRWVANPGQSHRVSSMRKVWPQKSRSDVVFAVSSGVVTSYDGEGRMNWQSKQGPTWARAGEFSDIGMERDWGRRGMEGRPDAILCQLMKGALCSAAEDSYSITREQAFHPESVGG